MATVSGKYGITLTVTLLVTVFVSGCSSLMPVEKLANDTDRVNGVEDGPQQAAAQAADTLPGHTADSYGAAAGNRPQIISPSDDAPLPRQAYNSSGGKVPYIPQPNPYTNLATPVPTEAKSIYVVASSLLQQGRLKEARTQFLKLTEKFPSLSGPWVKLGAIAEKEEKYDEAITHYKKAISVNKDNVNAYTALGLAQRRQGYFSDAQTTYLAALDVWKDFPEAHLNLAILYDLYANKPEEAQKHYEAYSFLTGGKNKKVHKWLAEVKQRTGIEGSFIDIPPLGLVEVTIEEVDDAGTKTSGSIAAGSDSASAPSTVP